jgi:hypothetical protein
MLRSTPLSRASRSGLVAFALCALAWPLAVSAHASQPAQVATVAVGPYPLVVSLYASPAHAGTALPVTIAPDPRDRGRLTYAVTAVPGPGVDATPVRGRVEPHPDVPGGAQGQVNLPVAGLWRLRVAVDGPYGHAAWPAGAGIAVQALPPTAIPLWLGWAIGLIPVFGGVGFLLAQRWQLRRLPEPGASALRRAT